MDKWDLLSLLRENQDNHNNNYVSGEEISKKFKITRAAVWKMIQELKNIGYEIESKTKNGYKITRSFDILNEFEIKSRLKKKNLNYEVFYKQSTGSTNSDAKKIAGKNDAIIAASEQTDGKGRYGRTFSSKNNCGIYFTVKINQDNINQFGSSKLNIDDITFFPLIAAVAVYQAVYDLCGINLFIKWPNDLLYKSDDKNYKSYKNYKKVCGILTEASIEAETRNIAYVIVGIGLNVNNAADDFPDEIKDAASSLNIISGKKYVRADILCQIINNLTEYINMNRTDLLREYKKRLLLGVDVSFAQNGRIFKAKTHDINNSGNLLAELETGEIITIQSGEINFL